MVADFDWDEVSDWPRDGVMRWWKQGWDWESLKTKKCPHPDYETYADYYAPTFAFPDPRVEENPPLISEKDYWGMRWLTEFAGKTWDIYHLPTFDPETGNKSPKHHEYKGDDKWSDEDIYHLPTFDPTTDEPNLSPKHDAYEDGDKWSDEDRNAFALGLKARMCAGKEFEDISDDRRAPFPVSLHRNG